MNKISLLAVFLIVSIISTITSIYESLYLWIFSLIILQLSISLIWFTFGKKANIQPRWTIYLAWIPFVRLYLISKIAQTNWLPVLIIFFTPVYLLATLAGLDFGDDFAMLTLMTISMVTLIIFTLIWEWKIFKRFGFPGWWTLSNFAPVIIVIIHVLLFVIGGREYSAYTNSFIFSFIASLTLYFSYFLLAHAALYGRDTVARNKKLEE